MGYIPPTHPPRLNLDRNGMPRDYATYVWLLYRRHVDDRSPARLAFLGASDRAVSFYPHPRLGTQG